MAKTLKEYEKMFVEFVNGKTKEVLREPIGSRDVAEEVYGAVLQFMLSSVVAGFHFTERDGSFYIECGTKQFVKIMELFEASVLELEPTTASTVMVSAKICDSPEDDADIIDLFPQER